MAYLLVMRTDWSRRPECASSFPAGNQISSGNWVRMGKAAVSAAAGLSEILTHYSYMRLPVRRIAAA
jgi:hypothetical protein